ncbi:hypothetical protein PRZ48_000216 [Zasmidium cellare]|uniref:Zn(2)-C6 fungal-type domain-containing protein n=1 Tax=Zasmidium cellare TaxID=395010 RepID=A0ABR0EXU9_ZASCE|nr:hypothetical protein PRZ48_000216 [Zasmidium cellare]
MDANAEIPAHRACAACRGQKVRCIPDDSNPDICQRCARSGRTCVFTPLMKRKQRKRTDTRVAELEREMRAMRAALQVKGEAARGSKSPKEGQQGPQRTSEPQGLWYKDMKPDGVATGPAGNWEFGGEERSAMARVQRAGPQLWPSGFKNGPLQDVKDVVDSGMISMATARHLFESYRTDVFPHYPMVAIPNDISAEQMRATKPALFLAIIAASAGKENSELSAALDKEVLQAYATRSLVQSEKSLELVQALLVSAVWYHPPSKFGQLKYYEYIHMAATMAMDIGIGTRPTQHRSGRFAKRESRPRTIHPAEDVNNPDLSMTPRSRDSSPDTASIEARRTFLAVYIICVGVSMSLRRPNTLRCSSYIRESVEYIERSPNAIPTDRTLVAWTRLIMIAEEISTSWCYDDPGGIASITELRTQLMMKDFDKRLTSWYTNLPETDVGTGAMMIMYYTIRLYLFEVALHIDHSSEDFKAPYQMGGIQPYPVEDEVPTQVLADAIANCIQTSHALLNTFLAMDVEGCRSLPVFSYVRVSFAAFVLAKLCLSAAHPRSRIAKVLDRSSLKVETYMDKAILHVRNIVGVKRSRVPSIFLALLFKLRQWCLNPDIIDHFEDEPEQPNQIENGHDMSSRMIQDKVSGGIIELDGARITEQISSSESSPQALNTHSQTTSSSHLAPIDEMTFVQGVTPVSQSDSVMQYGSGSDESTSGAQPQPMMSTTAASNDAQWQATGDPMVMDSELLQFIAQMNEGVEGGLTGLDDWASIPLEQMEQMNWSMGHGATNLM